MTLGRAIVKAKRRTFHQTNQTGSAEFITKCSGCLISSMIHSFDVKADQSRRVRTHENNSGGAVGRLGTIIQSIFCAQSGASIRLTVWKWSGESRYPGAFPPVLENFVSPFLLVWPTAPGSPRMDYTLIQYEQLMRQEWTMKAAGNRTCIIMLRFSDFKSQMASYPNRTWLILIKNGIIPKKWYLTIIPRDRMGSELIAREAEGRMGYESSRNNCFSKIQLVGQKYRE